MRRETPERRLIRAVWRDLRACDWRCHVCGTDPAMLETDIATEIRQEMARWRKRPRKEARCGKAR